MMSKLMIKKNAKGFTLVEVIVVAVIVAVLALVAVQLYQGYVKESRKNTAENLAASAAGFIQSLIAAGGTDPGDQDPWAGCSGCAAGANTVSFVIPANASVKLAGGVVTAKVGPAGQEQPSTGTYKYRE